MNHNSLIDTLVKQRTLSLAEFQTLIFHFDDVDAAYAAGLAREITRQHFGNRIYIRGLMEFTNHCRNDCLYCGIRRGNQRCVRYRLTQENILACCEEGYALGFRTLVLQGGEDPFFTDDRLVRIVSAMRAGYPDCAITLSVGERSRQSYRRLFDAGANRYLLRHETADPDHYRQLHPESMSWQRRMDCLHTLKDIGYQTGCGSMVGSPFQTAEHLAKDLLFVAQFQPEMLGIGPFLPHRDTPFGGCPAGSAATTLFLLSLYRIMLPQVLLPATTALGTARGDGRQLGVLAGANVVMPNLSPLRVRKQYMLYDNKEGTEDDTAHSLAQLRAEMREIGYEVVTERGDHATREAK